MAIFKKKTENTVNPRKFGDELGFAGQEAYNLLRTNLTFSLGNKNGGKVIGITSSCPQEGKSFTSVNLAIALAKNGNKVCLVDGDMRRPNLALSLSLSQAPGLSNYLAGQGEANIQPTGLNEKLDIITAGDIPPNPSELIGSAEMKSLLEKLSAEYDYVVMDLPPVLSVSDALVVSSYTDGIILVVRHGVTRRKEVRETIRQMRFASVRILGFLYNGYSRKLSSYKGYRKYGYYKGAKKA